MDSSTTSLCWDMEFHETNEIFDLNYFFGWLGGWLEKVELRLTSALDWVEVELSWGWALQNSASKQKKQAEAEVVQSSSLVKLS